MTGVLVPLAELLLYLLAYQRVVRKLKFLPVLLLNKVKTVMGRSCLLSLLALAFGTTLYVAADNPLSQAFTLFGFHSALNAASFVQARRRPGPRRARVPPAAHTSASALPRPAPSLLRRCSSSGRSSCRCPSARSDTWAG